MSPSEEEAFLRRARASVDEAEDLASSGHCAGTISRAYYAMYQAAQAVLARAGLAAKTHKGLRLRLRQAHAFITRVEDALE